MWKRSGLRKKKSQRSCGRNDGRSIGEIITKSIFFFTSFWLSIPNKKKWAFFFCPATEKKNAETKDSAKKKKESVVYSRKKKDKGMESDARAITVVFVSAVGNESLTLESTRDGLSAAFRFFRYLHAHDFVESRSDHVVIRQDLCFPNRARGGSACVISSSYISPELWDAASARASLVDVYHAHKIAEYLGADDPHTSDLVLQRVKREAQHAHQYDTPEDDKQYVGQ